MNAQTEVPSPSFLRAACCFAGIVAILGVGLFHLDVPIHALLFLCLCWAVVNARAAGATYGSVRDMMIAGISEALPAIFIFFLIGIVIASYMVSGTVAALMVFGLDWLTPGTFLVLAFVLAALMSLATGTSWGTVGTVGVVFMGIGEAMGVSAPLVAGVVISGATFGDKLSPVSDTTNLAAMSAGTDLFTHIRAMLYTTVPTFLIVLAILLALATVTPVAPMPAQPERIRSALLAAYEIDWLVASLPIVVMLVLSLRRVPPEVCMTASAAAALLLAFVQQDRSATELLGVLWQNQPGTTGIASLDGLLGRGGMASMSWTLMLALLALALGGVLLRGRFLEVLLAGLTRRVRRPASLVAATIGTGVLGNAALGEAYVSIILTAQTFRPAYAGQRLSPALLSRSVEEGATLTTGLIPWTTAGAFYAATLGVPTLDYVPYAFLNYLNPLVAIVMASLGIGLMGAGRGAGEGTRAPLEGPVRAGD
ncbi:MAG TPA: Na+/H+ antiporter NhaC family protein [Pseudomonadales bacterium]|nr:Na+/H+ antiporter NhaC family protein [Pseudomonadales bacterium]